MMQVAMTRTEWQEPAADAPGWLENVESGRRHALAPVFADPETGAEMRVAVDLDRAAERFAAEWARAGSMWDRFAAVLPPFTAENAVTLGEGGTPLTRSEGLARDLGLKNLFFKLEGSNPTGSFKDRQMSVAMTMGRLWGRRRYATVSSGNVGNALSAYCAKAGAEGHVWVADNTAESKRRQISVYGAQLYLIPAPGPGRMRAYWQLYADMRAFCTARGIVPMVSARPVNPFMVEGTKTISFEIAAALGQVDEVWCCIGGGGLLGGVHKGFTELVGLGRASAVPRIHGGQRADKGHAPIDRLHEPEFAEGDYYLPLDGDWAVQSIRASGGSLTTVTADEITEAQALLATRDGIFAEPQGAYAAAALIRAARQGRVDPEATTVCTITGSGLKDMAAAEAFGRFVPQKPVLPATRLEDADLAAEL
jgi:threonine synthase